VEESTQQLVIPAKAGIHSTDHIKIQVSPFGIRLLDQLNLPLSLPLLDPFLSGYSIMDMTVYLIIYETVHTILLCKSLHEINFVLIHSLE